MVLHSTDEALSLFIEMKLTKSQYMVRRQAQQKTAHIYPSYPKLRECCPHNDTTVITDSVAEVKLQVPLDHVVLQLLKDLGDVIATLSDDECHKTRSHFHLGLSWQYRT